MVLSTEQSRIEEVIDGIGTPWLSSTDLEWAQDWPLILKYTVPDNPGLPQLNELNGRVGLRGEDNRIELALKSNSELGLTTPFIVGLGMAIGIPNFVALGERNPIQYRNKREEVPRTIESLHATIETTGIAFDDINSLPAAPRPVVQLDRTQAPWTASEEWNAIDWSPEDELRGSYWMERTEDNRYAIHGMADVDGDGIPCHYILIEGETIQRQTGEDVY